MYSNLWYLQQIEDICSLARVPTVNISTLLDLHQACKEGYSEGQEEITTFQTSSKLPVSQLTQPQTHSKVKTITPMPVEELEGETSRRRLFV